MSTLSAPTSVAPQTLRVDLRLHAGVALLALLFLAAGVAGYSAMDDLHYLRAADQWRNSPPFIGGNHWEVRLPHVLAIALSFEAFGRTELAMQVPMLLSYAGALVLTVRLLQGVADAPTAALAAAFVAATPVFALYAKIPYPDEVELFLVLLSFHLFRRGLSERRALLLLASGIAAGVAWVIRASSVPLALLYAILFLAGYGMPRRHYLWMLAGFLPVLLGEWLFYYLTVGNPFHRIMVDARALELPSAHMTGSVAGGLHQPFNWELMAKWKPNSVVDVHWLVNPYIDFLTNPGYGAIYLTGLAGAITLYPSLKRDPRTKELFRLLAILCACWVFVVIYVLNLRAQPRYFSPLTWTCCVLTAIWLRRIVWRRSRHLAVAIVAGMLVADLVLVRLRTDPLEAQRVLASYAAAQASEPVWTNLDHAGLFLDEVGATPRVHLARPSAVPEGGLYFVTRDDARRLGIDAWPVAWRHGGTPGTAAPYAAPQGAAARLVGKLVRGGPREVVVLRRPVASAAH